MILVAMLVATLWQCVETKGDLARRNRDEVLAIAGEQASEVGPDYVQALAHHEELLRRYLELSEHRSLSVLLRRFQPDLSPSKRLSPVVSQLSSVGKPDEAQHQINKAAREV